MSRLLRGGFLWLTHGDGSAELSLFRTTWQWLATSGDFAGDCYAAWLMAPQFRAARACRLRHVLGAGLLVKNAVSTAQNENTNLGGG